MIEHLTISLQALVAASIFFVWVIRYDNIVQEFKQYGLPDGLRDLVGILKITFVLMLLIGIERGFFAVAGGVGIAILMAAAVVTHLRMKNPLVQNVTRLGAPWLLSRHRRDQLSNVGTGIGGLSQK
jgi:uncharacterized membrane protein YphA (DoxX/SURF4 family)